MKSFKRNKAHLIILVLASGLGLMLTLLTRLSGASAPAPGESQKHLTLADRLTYQRAIEEVYWRHRIWPAENPKPKPSLDEVMAMSEIEAKVVEYLRKSEALDRYWQRPITGEQLQAEMERMAAQTRQPDILRETWEALGNDPFVIAECMARPVLVDRLIRNWYAQDERFHGQLKQRALAELGQHSTAGHMRRMSGSYSEAQWVKEERAKAYGRDRAADREEIVLSEEEWEERRRSLAQRFSRRSDEAGLASREARAGRELEAEERAEDELERVAVGKLSQMQEDEERYYAMAVIEKGRGRLKVATVEWRKEAFEQWWAREGKQVEEAGEASGYEYRLASISAAASSCAVNTWKAMGIEVPSVRVGQTAVWTGSEVIVWGGIGDSLLNTGGRYNPSTDSWITTIATNAPDARAGHTAVWTGSEVIVWGGIGNGGLLNTGGRYNPSTDSWTATSTTNAPGVRFFHTAVWTGSEMIVWGGQGNIVRLNTGGGYNPSTDSWTATSATNAPSARQSHTAVWTGSEMIVWGGQGNTGRLNTGGRYNPSTDSWTTTSTANAPGARPHHKAV